MRDIGKSIGDELERLEALLAEAERERDALAADWNWMHEKMVNAVACIGNWRVTYRVAGKMMPCDVYGVTLREAIAKARQGAE